MEKVSFDKFEHRHANKECADAAYKLKLINLAGKMQKKNFSFKILKTDSQF